MHIRFFAFWYFLDSKINYGIQAHEESILERAASGGLGGVVLDAAQELASSEGRLLALAHRVLAVKVLDTDTTATPGTEMRSVARLKLLMQKRVVRSEIIAYTAVEH